VKIDAVTMRVLGFVCGTPLGEFWYKIVKPHSTPLSCRTVPRDPRLVRPGGLLRAGWGLRSLLPGTRLWSSRVGDEGCAGCATEPLILLGRILRISVRTGERDGGKVIPYGAPFGLPGVSYEVVWTGADI
jgi:hypothetical protein